MSDIIKIDNRELKKLSKSLKIKRPSQVSAIIRSTLNDQAFSTQKQAKKSTIPKYFHNRTAWIASSILVDKAKGRDIKKMQSETGAKKRWKRNPSRDFLGMRQQEKGESLRRPGIHTLQSRGGAFSKRVRPSLRRNKLGRLRKITRKKQIREHDFAGNKSAMEIMSSTGIRHGVYRFVGGRTGTTKGTKIRRIRMVVDLSRSTVSLPRRPWLAQARKKAVNQSTTNRFYKRNFVRYTKSR